MSAMNRRNKIVRSLGDKKKVNVLGKAGLDIKQFGPLAQ